MGFTIFFSDGVSKAENLLMSEDVKAAIGAIKKLKSKQELIKKTVKYWKSMMVLNIKKFTIDAKNSGLWADSLVF